MRQHHRKNGIKLFGMKLSVCYITFNEETFIQKNIVSIYEIADEIIIVDSFSSDRTKEICTQFEKVQFLENKFLGFGPQKNHALSYAKGDWILFLDADEILDAEAIQQIKEIISAEKTPFEVYKIHFNNILMNTVMRFGGWGNVWRERLFKKKAGKYSEDIVHETFLTESAIGKLKGNINHYTYKNISSHIEKMNSYSQLMADKKAGKKKTPIFKVIFSPFFAFFKNYFLKLGFLDGLAGFYAAKVIAFYTFLKYMKIVESSRKMKI